MSLMKTVLKQYTRVPVEVLNILSPLYHILPLKIRLGKIYNREKKNIDKRAAYTADELDNLQLVQLRDMLKYAYFHVPYYRELFDAIRFDVEKIDTVHDIEKIPVLTKELLIKNREKLISDEYNKEKLVYVTTSGSTGVPTGFYVEEDSHMRDLVYVESMFKDYGYSVESSKMVLRGKSFNKMNRGGNYQWDAFRRILNINIFDMSPETLESYCEQIERYKPEFAYGYMSAMYTLCKYISVRPEGLKHKFKAFIGISESITETQKLFVESVIQAPVLTFYGMSERVIIAKENHETGKYIPDKYYGITEIVDDNNIAIKDNGLNGVLVGTSLLNHGMPLIRYKMDDVASWADYGAGILNPIEGRKDRDVLVTKDGQCLSMASLEVHSRVYDLMSRYQFCQERPGQVTIKVQLQKGIEPSEEICSEISSVFANRTQHGIDFTTIIVDKIEPKKNGKFSIIDQKIDLKTIGSKQ